MIFDVIGVTRGINFPERIRVLGVKLATVFATGDDVDSFLFLCLLLFFNAFSGSVFLSAENKNLR